jgi:hypothetical protein
MAGLFHEEGPGEAAQGLAAVRGAAGGRVARLPSSGTAPTTPAAAATDEWPASTQSAGRDTVTIGSNLSDCVFFVQQTEKQRPSYWFRQCLSFLERPRRTKRCRVGSLQRLSLHRQPEARPRLDFTPVVSQLRNLYDSTCTVDPRGRSLQELQSESQYSNPTREPRPAARRDRDPMATPLGPLGLATASTVRAVLP